MNMKAQSHRSGKTLNEISKFSPVTTKGVRSSSGEPFLFEFDDTIVVSRLIEANISK